MIKIAISQAAFDAIAATLPLGSVGYETDSSERGQCLVWLEDATQAAYDREEMLAARRVWMERWAQFLSSHRLSWADRAAAVAYLKERGVAYPSPSDLMYGGVIGSVLVTGIVTRHSSPWFRGPYALVFADPRPEPFMSAKGQVGLFRLQSL